MMVLSKEGSKAYSVLQNLYDSVGAFIKSYLYSYYFNLGNKHLKNHEINQAIKDYNNAIKSNPYKTEAYHNRAKAYIENADYVHALEDYAKVEELQETQKLKYKYLKPIRSF